MVSKTTESIIDNAVTTSKLADNSVTSAKVQNNSLNSDDILDMPGTAQVSSLPRNSFTSFASGINTLDSITVNVPAAGYVFVTGSLSANISHTLNTTDECYFQLMETRALIDYNKPGFLQLRLPNVLPTYTSGYTFPIQLTRVFKISSAGSYTFYLNYRFFYGWDSGDQYYDAQLNAIFIPVAYGTVDE